MAQRDFRAQRLFVDANLEEGLAVACTPAQANYLRNVLRLRAGESILLFNGRAGEWRAEIGESGKRGLTLTLRERVRPQESGPDIHYLFAPLKRARLDYMVQKATELGVAALRPVITRRTVAERVNVERMRANVVEAAEQCGVLRLPEVSAPAPLDKVLSEWDSGRRLIFCDEGADVHDPIAALKGVPEGPLAVLVGPEGGFEEGERARLLRMPCATAVSLGPRVMRADTAAVAALALVNATLGDWR
jgi:16S rRNA (uracil1498-N3)-methyltransferase